MIGSAIADRNHDWAGNRVLRRDGCYGHDDKDHTRFTDDTGGQGDGDQSLQASRKSSGRSPRKQSRPCARLSRRLTLAIAAKEYIWLWDFRHGISVKAIASREDLSLRRVRFGLARAEAHERGYCNDAAVKPPRLVPLFPIGSYTPLSGCRHKQPIQTGSLLCCMVCHESGLDGHPALQRDPRTDPAPEPTPPSKPASLAKETRRKRRERQFRK
jgi:hypothetical protein